MIILAIWSSSNHRHVVYCWKENLMENQNMLIRMYQIEISKNDKLLKRFNWGGTELLTLSYKRLIFLYNHHFFEIKCYTYWKLKGCFIWWYQFHPLATLWRYRIKPILFSKVRLVGTLAITLKKKHTKCCCFSMKNICETCCYFI